MLTSVLTWCIIAIVESKDTSVLVDASTYTTFI